MRVGLFGGTFDPPHVGHLLLASDAHDTLRLDRVVFVPAAQQPLKVGRTVAAAAARLDMVRGMVGDDARFAVDSVEIDRSGLSYTVETLELYAERHPDAERFFLIGSDSLPSLESWRQPERVVALARLAVLMRSTEDGSPMTAAELGDRVRAIGGADALEPVIVTVRRIDVSSTEIRGRVRDGKPIAGFVVDAVARYIAARGLYR